MTAVDVLLYLADSPCMTLTRHTSSGPPGCREHTPPTGLDNGSSDPLRSAGL